MRLTGLAPARFALCSAKDIPRREQEFESVELMLDSVFTYSICQDLCVAISTAVRGLTLTRLRVGSSIAGRNRIMIARFTRDCEYARRGMFTEVSIVVSPGTAVLVTNGHSTNSWISNFPKRQVSSKHRLRAPLSRAPMLGGLAQMSGEESRGDGIVA
jgi:hypothetical protein